MASRRIKVTDLNETRVERYLARPKDAPRHDAVEATAGTARSAQAAQDDDGGQRHVGRDSDNG